jgi:hypothetical protein
MTIRYRVVDRLSEIGRWCGNLLGSAGSGERGIFSPYISITLPSQDVVEPTPWKN